MTRRKSHLFARPLRELPAWGRALVALAAFAVFVLAFVGPAHELCFSDGDHFAIEPAHVQCPAGGSVASAGPAAPSDAGLSVGVAANSTGMPCADVSLGVDLQNTSGDRAKLPVPQPIQICAAVSQILDSISAAPRAVPAPVTAPSRPPNLAALRTVVLRC